MTRSSRSLLFGVVLAASLPIPLLAQQPSSPSEAQPERPTVATHAGTVAPGYWEFEGGLELDGVGQGDRSTSAPLTLKLGLARAVQLSLIGTVGGLGQGAGVADARVGIKWRFADHLLGNRVAILPEFMAPTPGRPAGGTLLILVSHELGAIDMDVNAGFTRRTESGTGAPRSESLWTVSFGGPAAGRLGWTAELYEFPATAGPAGQPARVALLGGPTWQAVASLVFDAGVILPLEGPQPRALYAGLTRNLGRIPGIAR